MKKSNRIVLGLCMTAVVVFTFLMAENASAQGSDPVQVLFVANGYYQQETDIADHLTDLGVYDVTIVEDNQVTGSTDLSTYDLLIITEFAPGISYTGLQNIESSGKPVMIVEYWDFWYSYKLGLVADDWAGYYGTDTVDVIEGNHPVTYFFDQSIQVYSSAYTIYGIPFNDIASGVIPLVYSSASYNEVAVISDDTRKIVATGIYDTTRYTVDGWRLFDAILSYLYPIDDETTDPDEINEALAASGVLEIMEQISDSPSEWTYETAVAEIWSRLFSKKITFLFDNLSKDIQGLVSGNFKMTAWTNPELHIIRGVLKSKPGYEDECEDWANQLDTNVGNVVPHRIGYYGTQVNSAPLLWFETSDLDTIFTGDAKHFKIGLQTFLYLLITPLNPFDPNEPAGPSHMVKVDISGSTKLLSKEDLFYYGGQYPDYIFMHHFWGRGVDGFWPWDQQTNDPLVMITNSEYRSSLVFYKYDENKPLREENYRCALNLFMYQEMGDYEVFELDEDPLTYMECPREGKANSLPHDYCQTTDWTCKCNVSKQLFYGFRFQPPIYYDSCIYEDSFDATADGGIPNTFQDITQAAVWDDENNDWDYSPKNDGELPRLQLAAPSYQFYSQYEPTEKWCWDHTNVCSDLYDEANAAIFKESALGMVQGEPEWDASVPGEHFYYRYNPNDLMWEEMYWWVDYGDPRSYKGPWRIPHVTAGMETDIGFVIRRPIEADPSLDDAYCFWINSTFTEPYRPVAYLVYYDHDAGTYILPSEGEINGFRDAGVESDLMVKMACYHEDWWGGAHACIRYL